MSSLLNVSGSKNSSGFGHDPENNMVEADDSVWDDYLKVKLYQNV